MIPLRHRLAFGAVVLAAAGAVSAAQAHERVLFETDWRHGIDARLGVQAAEPDDVRVERAPHGPGPAYYLDARIRRDADYSKVVNGAPRAEVVFSNVARFVPGTRYVIEWLTQIPPDYALDGPHVEIIMQIHQGSSAGSPPIMLTLTGDHYTVSVRGGADTQHGTGTSICCASADKGVWIAWRLEYTPESDSAGAETVLRKGVARASAGLPGAASGVAWWHAEDIVWRHTFVVYAGDGQRNAYPGDREAYLKLGLYAPDHWAGSADDVRVRALHYGPVRILQLPEGASP